MQRPHRAGALWHGTCVRKPDAARCVATGVVEVLQVHLYAIYAACQLSLCGTCSCAQQPYVAVIAQGRRVLHGSAGQYALLRQLCVQTFGMRADELQAGCGDTPASWNKAGFCGMREASIIECRLACKSAVVAQRHLT
jgi:hypothetical protein